MRFIRSICLALVAVGSLAGTLRADIEESCVCNLLQDLGVQKANGLVTFNCGEGNIASAIAELRDRVGGSATANNQSVTWNGITCVISFSQGAGNGATASGSADVVVAVGGQLASGSGNGGGASATNNQDGGAALSVGGNGAKSGSSGGSTGGTATTSKKGGGTGAATGGNGAGEGETTAKGGDASTTTTSATGVHGDLWSYGGDGGNAFGGGSEGGNGGDATITAIKTNPPAQNSSQTWNGKDDAGSGNHGSGAEARREGSNSSGSDGSSVSNS